MSDELGRDEADPSSDNGREDAGEFDGLLGPRVEPSPIDGDFLEFYDRQAPFLAVYLRSAIRGSGLSQHDAEDILQETWGKFFDAIKSRRVDHPRAYSLSVLASCFQEHLSKTARLPNQVPDNLVLPDHRALAPDQAALEREELGLRGRRRVEIRAWLERFLPVLDQMQVELSHLEWIKRAWPVLGRDGHPRGRRRRGKPTSADKAHWIIENLPGQIAFLRRFLRELH
jgi:DNA-directed RNA polymerase specialized sigma24 family protein